VRNESFIHLLPPPSSLLLLLLLLLLPPSVVSIEDPFDQDDWEAWSRLTAQVGIQVVGDDLTVTNPKRIERAAEERACNCLLLKVNQIGSVTEAIQAYVGLSFRALFKTLTQSLSLSG